MGIAFGVLFFSGCSEFELFPDKSIIFEGRIVEAFDSAKPLDSVRVRGCLQNIIQIPSWPSCDVETITDVNGRFRIEMKANNLTARGIQYDKEGYSSLDSCITKPNGELECYVRALPTIFYIFSPTKAENPFVYDSLIVNVSTDTRDTTVLYITRFFQNTQGGITYFWTNQSETVSPWNKSYTTIQVSDNSIVKIKSEYYKNSILETIHFDTLFCRKGISTNYKILDE